MLILDMVNAKNLSVVGKTQIAEQNTQTDTGFDMLLAEAGRRQSFEPSVERQSRNRDENRSRTEESRREETRPSRRERGQQAEETTSTAGTAVVQETPQSATAEAFCDYNQPVIDEAKVITEAAEIMKLPEEAVAKLLQKLELTPQDLTEPQAVVKMLQYALDAESPAELLTNPKFPEIYKAMNEAVAKAVPNAKNAEATVQYENTVKLETANVLAESLEGLEAAIEDGEVVVTNHQTSASTLRQQAAAQTVVQAEQVQISELTPELTDKSLLATDEPTADNSRAANPAFNIEAVTAKIEQAMRQAAPQQPVNITDVIEQIMNQVKLTSSGGGFSEIRMTLRPESLGDIVLRVLTQKGIITVQFEAESQRVKEMIEANFNMLRDALEEQGIQFSELSVFVRQDENERMSQFERARQNSRNRAESIEEISEADEITEISYHNGILDVSA